MSTNESFAAPAAPPSGGYGGTSWDAQPGVLRASAERFWYVVWCIYFGFGYLSKIPTKKALSDAASFTRTAA